MGADLGRHRMIRLGVSPTSCCWRLAFVSSVWWLLLFSHSVVSDSLRPHGLQHTRLPCPSPSPGACSNSCPLNQRCHRTMTSSVTPSPTFNLSQHQGLFQQVSSSHQVAKVWEFQLQHQSLQ